MSSDLDEIEACEQRLVNLWPSVDFIHLGKWGLRFANGYSGRANSASALWRGADLSRAEIGYIVSLFRGAGLQPAIRLTPLADNSLAARLEGMGWHRRTASTGMIAGASNTWAAAPIVTFDAKVTTEWLDGVSRLQPDPTKASPEHLGAIVSRIRTGAGFATIHHDGAPVGYGMVSCDRGYAEIGSIILAPAARGKGLGRTLVESMLAHGVSLGAEKVFLQVEQGNTPAENLYRSLGFRFLYPYSEYRLTSAQ